MPNRIVYPSVENLQIRVGSQWPSSSLRFLTNLLPFRNLKKITLNVRYYHSYSNSIYYEQYNLCLKQIFQLAPLLHSLDFSIESNYLDYLSKKQLNLSTIIPTNIKHFKMNISQIDHMNMIINQLKSLSSIQFRYSTFSDNSDLFVQWLQQHQNDRPYQTYRIDHSSLFLWINHHR